MATALPFIALGLGAVGTGISTYSGIQSAKTQEQYAMLNAQAQQAQAQMQSNLAQVQASFEAQKSKNAQQAAAVNAQALRGEAEQKAKAGRVNLDRQRQEQLRMLSMIRAQQGKTGTVADTGSQLDVLLNAAELQALENAESQYQTEIQRRQLFREAENQSLGANTYGMQSQFDILEGQSRASQLRAQGVQARIQGLAGAQAARGAMLGAIGSGISGFTNLGSNYYQMRQLLPQRTV